MKFSQEGFAKGFHTTTVNFSKGFNVLDSGIKYEEEPEEEYAIDQNELIQRMNQKNLKLTAELQEARENYQRMKRVNEGLMQQLCQRDGDKSEMDYDKSMA